MLLSAVQGHTRFPVKVTAKTEPFNLVGDYRHWQEPTAPEALVIADRSRRCCESLELVDVSTHVLVLHG
jgi:hypothetical protein